MRSTALVILALVFVVCLVSCNRSDKADLWENATYLEDTELGEGAKIVRVEVKVENRTVAFTVKTNKNTVGEALIEHDLLAGDDSQYGLYIKVVNGITADYDVDQSYWAFYINGEYAMTGVDTTEINEGDVYQLVYTKG